MVNPPSWSSLRSLVMEANQHLPSFTATILNFTRHDLGNSQYGKWSASRPTHITVQHLAPAYWLIRHGPTVVAVTGDTRYSLPPTWYPTWEVGHLGWGHPHLFDFPGSGTQVGPIRASKTGGRAVWIVALKKKSEAQIVDYTIDAESLMTTGISVSGKSDAVIVDCIEFNTPSPSAFTCSLAEYQKMMAIQSPKVTLPEPNPVPHERTF